MKWDRLDSWNHTLKSLRLKRILDPGLPMLCGLDFLDDLMCSLRGGMQEFKNLQLVSPLLYHIMCFEFCSFDSWWRMV